MKPPCMDLISSLVPLKTALHPQIPLMRVIMGMSLLPHHKSIDELTCTFDGIFNMFKIWLYIHSYYFSG